MAQTMISVAHAHEMIDAAVAAAGVTARERVGFRDAIGRVLAADVTAPFSLPRFTNSAMDGFAVRAADIANAPVRLSVSGIVRAGEAAATPVAPGEAVQIMTGAPLPSGADTVVPVEQTSGYGGDTVEVRTSIPADRNVRHAGEEVEAGATVIAAGTRVGPAELGVIASLGFAEVDVFARPRIAIFGTGDELREPGTPLGDGEIYNSNLWVLSDLAQRAGADVVEARIVRDDADALRDFLAAALACDVVVSSGGVSMGEHDLVRGALSSLGVEERFWKVAQKPAKPLAFGVRDATLVFGLPGNPVSSAIAFLEYVHDALIRLQGGAPTPPERARLAAPFPCDPGKHRFLFGAFDATGAVRPSTRLGSHMLSAGLGADALIGVPPGAEPLPVGALVEVRRLRWGGLGT